MKIKIKKIRFYLILLLLIAGFLSPQVFAQDPDPDPAPDPNPVIQPLVPKPDPAPTKAAQVNLLTVQGKPEWMYDSLLTGALKFVVRGKEALAWTLAIKTDGFDSPAVEKAYRQVRTIVNSLFILGLLAIAAMWMFRFMVPRARLKKTVILFVLGVIFVNFAFPVNRLLIDGTNLLQRTLLTKDSNPIGMIDIVSVPEYQKAIGYQNKTGLLSEMEQSRLKFSFEGNTNNIPLGSVRPDPATVTSLQGTLTGPTGGTIDLKSLPAPQILELKTNQALQASVESSKTFNPGEEQRLFSFGLLMLTGLAYFLIAFLLILRVVILWGFLILSPLLILFAIFNSTRGYFYQWTQFYGRWLLIGPLIALGISVIINLWQIVGVPITSSYLNSTEQFGALSNIRILLPGNAAANDLSTTNQMMEYLIFLIMLYLPLIMGFALTRKKTWPAFAEAAESGSYESTVRTRGGREGMAASPSAPEAKESPSPKETGLFGTVKDFLGSRFSRFTEAALPPALKTTSGAPPLPVSSLSFRPEALALATVPDLLRFMGANMDSRASRERAIEKLAARDTLTDPVEQGQVRAVWNEIEHRAENGDAEAGILRSEIRAIEETVTPSAAPGTMEANVSVSVTPALEIMPPAIIHEERPEREKEIRHDEKTEKQNVEPLKAVPEKPGEESEDETSELEQKDESKKEDEKNKNQESSL